MTTQTLIVRGTNRRGNTAEYALQRTVRGGNYTRKGIKSDITVMRDATGALIVFTMYGSPRGGFMFLLTDCEIISGEL